MFEIDSRSGAAKENLEAAAGKTIETVAGLAMYGAVAGVALGKAAYDMSVGRLAKPDNDAELAARFGHPPRVYYQDFGERRFIRDRDDRVYTGEQWLEHHLLGSE